MSEDTNRKNPNLADLSPDDPSTVVIWCPACDENSPIYLNILPNHGFPPDDDLRVHHGDWCKVIRGEIVELYEWPDGDIAENIQSSLIECYRLIMEDPPGFSLDSFTGWMTDNNLKRPSEISN